MEPSVQSSRVFRIRRVYSRRIVFEAKGSSKGYFIALCIWPVNTFALPTADNEMLMWLCQSGNVGCGFAEVDVALAIGGWVGRWQVGIPSRPNALSIFLSKVEPFLDRPYPPTFPPPPPSKKETTCGLTMQDTYKSNYRSQNLPQYKGWLSYNGDPNFRAIFRLQNW